MATPLSNELLALVYGTTTDPSLWPAFCQEFSKTTGASVMMFGHATDSYHSVGLLGGGWDPELLQTYDEYYGALNPWMDMNLKMPVGVVGTSDMALSRDQLVRTEFYNDWLRHQNEAIAGPAMICHRSKQRFVALAASERGHLADEKMPHLVNCFKALSPHIMRAIEMSSVLHARSIGSAVLETSHAGVILIHRSGKVGYCNDAAVRFLKGNPTIHLRYDDRLIARNEAVGKYLEDCCKSMIMQQFNTLPGCVAVDQFNDRPILLHAHIIPQMEQGKFPETMWLDPIVGAFVITAPFGLHDAVPLQQILETFAATPAEVRLGTALIAGENLSAYADRREISRHTARNQLQSLLNKTATHSQAEFVGLVTSLLSPFHTPKV